MVIEQQAIAYTVSGDWAKLDAMIQEYNTGFPTTSGGTHKLVLAWGGIYGLYAGDVSGKSIDDVATQWLKARPNSTGARMLQAMVFDVKAVGLRGEGAASSVDPDVWPKYKKLMVEEKEFLLKNKDIADKDATWYQEMEMVARNLDDKELLYSTLQEGSKKFPTYQNIYLQAMEGRLPKWGGSAEEAEKIARMAAENNKNQSGLSYYSYIWFNAISFQPEFMTLLNKHEVISWDNMRQGWEDRYQQYPSTRTLNNILATACIARDKDVFLKADKMIQGQTEPDVWLQGVEYRTCQASFR
ncbi:DUF4034 domain-containing protein [Citrobacter portucalensis]|uniref:DUF4034 domain-containing protein n=1 Tax=Citrobacter portucalensis TaxID=1639133 RepID=UPI0025506437|nr:DUF4034 domain-containing protein [Citrobacter portucalensis]